MKTKKTTGDGSKPSRRAQTPEAAGKSAGSGAPSSKPEREDEDSEVVPLDPAPAGSEDEKTRERAADDGMPEDDGPRSSPGR